jgi:hypothetical protein
MRYVDTGFLQGDKAFQAFFAYYQAKSLVYFFNAGAGP